jgi:hypothetical protein
LGLPLAAAAGLNKIALASIEHLFYNLSRGSPERSYGNAGFFLDLWNLFLDSLPEVLVNALEKTYSG